ncbi:MAG TPA: aminoglycoside phosphotransferase family protein [Patescibacteria group bacterium]|nr:aminoglycoside phosphotransferase family protein [Patescibacteria group bacterium]
MIEKTRFESDKSILASRINNELGLELSDINPLNSDELGDNSEVYTAHTADTEVVIKLLPEVLGFEMEQAAFKLFTEHGIPAPKVLGVLLPDQSHKAVIVETLIPGKPISRNKENTQLYAEAGVVLKKIHGIKVEGYGTFEITEQGVRGTFSSWKANAEAFKLNFELLERKGLIDFSARTKLEHAHKITSNAPLPHASFIHSDYSPQHVFSDGKQITGIIDVATCYGGDPRQDIVNMQYFLNPKQREVFDAAYGPLASDQLIPYYAALAAANKVAYRSDRGFTDRLAEGLSQLKNSLTEI